MHLRKLVAHHPVTVGPNADLVGVAQIMREKHVGTVVVIDAENRPVGILTDRDLVVSVIAQDAKDLARLCVRDVCSTSLIVAVEDEDLDTLIARMRRHGVRRVPVVDRGGHLTGVFSMDDALAAIAEELASVAELLRTERRREELRRRTK